MKQRDKKQRMHDWLLERIRNPQPLPPQQDIQRDVHREIGGRLIDAERQERERRNK